MASWLDSVCAGFDFAVLSAVHDLAGVGGRALRVVMEFFSVTGEVGALVLVTALVLLLFKKTRKVGLCMIVAVIIGALFTNVFLKDFIARPRPFTSSEIYYEWWQAMGAYDVSDLSFPSGHVTAATAGAVALIVASKKRLAWLSLLYVALMALSRMYFVVHYPTDVLAGVLVGSIAACLACWLVNKVHSTRIKLQSKSTA